VVSVIQLKRFGFLPKPWCFETPEIAIEPLPGYEELHAYLLERQVFGYLYPCTSHLSRLTPEHPDGEKIEATTHTAAVWCPPASHIMVLKHPLGKDCWQNEGSAVLQFMALLAGTRLQFEDIGLDGRVRIDGNGGISLQEWDRGIIVQLALDYFKQLKALKNGKTKLSSTTRKLTWITSLYLFCMGESAVFDWQQLQLEFMALDGVWAQSGLKLLSSTHKHKHRFRSMHFSRIRTLAAEYKLSFDFVGRLDQKGQRWPSEAFIASEIVGLRNNLIHQCLWDNRQPGFAAKSSLAIYSPFYLRDFLERLFIAVVAGPNDFSKSPWTRLTSSLLILPKGHRSRYPA
jgi:hypothetical protein